MSGLDICTDPMLKGETQSLTFSYVLRYLAAVKMMKKIIEDNNLTV